MAPVTISEGGQITIPQAILDRLGAAPGDKVDLWFDRGYLIVRKAGGDWRDLGGILRDPDRPPLTPEDIDEAIGRFHREDNERILRQSKKKP